MTNLFSLNSLSVASFIIVLLPLGVVSAQTQNSERAPVTSPQETDKKKPVVSPENASDRLTPPSSKAKLTTRLESFVRQNEIHDQIRQELAKELDGTPKAIMGHHYFEILAGQDFANAVTPLSGAIEDHRQELGLELTATVNDLASQQKQEAQLKNEVDEYAAMINSGKVPTGQLAGKKRILLQIALREKDAESRVERREADIGYYVSQLKALVKLETDLEDMSEERIHHIQRVRDALKNEHRSHSQGELASRQDELTDALTILNQTKGPTKGLPTTDGNTAIRQGSDLEKASEENRARQANFTDEENNLLEEILSRSRTRTASSGR